MSRASSAARPFVALRVLSVVLDYAKGFLMPLLVFEQSGGSLLAAGLAYCVEFLPMALLTPAFGSLVDRSIGKRTVYVVETLRVALVGAWAVLAHLHASWLLSSAVSACSGLVCLFYEAAAAQRLEADELQRYQVVTQVCEPLARVAGPAGVGALLLVLPPERVLFVLTAGYGAAWMLSLAWSRATRLVRREAVAPWSPRTEWAGLTALGRNAPLLWLTVGTGFLNGFFGVFQSLLVPVMIGHYHVAASWSALPNVVGGGFALVVVIALRRLGTTGPVRRYGTMGMLALGGAAVLAFADAGPWSFALSFGLLILASALYGIFFRARRLALIPDEQRAQGLGATGALLMLFLPMSGLATMAGATWPSLAVIGVSGALATGALWLGTQRSEVAGRASALGAATT